MDGRHTLLNHFEYIAQATLARRILHFARAETGLDFGLDLLGNPRFSELLDLAMYVRASVIKAIANGTWILAFFDPDPDLHVRLQEYDRPGEVHNLAIRGSTERECSRCRNSNVIAHQTLYG